MTKLNTEEIKDFFDAVMETLNTLVIILDPQGRIVQMNQACERISGYFLDEIKGEYFWNVFIPEEEKNTMITAYQSLLKNKKGKLEHVNVWVNRTGERRLISWNNRCYPHGNNPVQYVIGSGIDITEQKEVEEKLKLAQQDLKNTISYHQGVIFKFIKIGDQYIHTMCEGNLHDSPLIPSLIGKSLEEIIPVDKALSLNTYYDRAWNGESSVYFEYTLLNGITLLVRLRPRWEDGRVIEVIGSAIDITDQKRIERAFRESEARYRLIAEHTTDLITVLDSQGRTLYASPSHETVLGYPPSALEGTLPLDHYHPEDKPIMHQVLREIRETKKPIEMVYRFRHANGHWIYIESRGVPVFDDSGELKIIVNISRDITKRKQTENELHEAKEQLRNIFDNLDEVFFSVDVATDRFLQISSSCESIIGINHADLLKDSSLLFSVIDPEDIPGIIGKNNELQSGRTVTYEHPIYHPTDGIKWLRAKAIPVMKEGQLTRIDGIITDITEQRKTEELLRKWERVSAVGEMAAGIAHEIRNPLTTLKGFLQLLQKQTDDPKYFTLMRSELERIEMVTNEFLMLAKPQAKQYIPIDVVVLLDGIITIYNTQAIIKKIQITLETDGTSPQILGDPNQLKQLFINLLKNSLESMTKGGNIVVKVASQENNQVLIQVIDQGCGIPEELISKLGEPFYTLKEKGTGLGLMISYKIIREHQGLIQIKSHVGVGTDIHISFPLAN
ncbi:PAS domain S-box protein [Ammoniphilus sp. CFH 90114]|uniref:PAS domain S-box protein n=1 Tax=Ammoniphilus sp. CFH 90114 TaxID=2493665 RepID=UPI0013E92069|nr:PAS domain S-box protein [Ammoniphilus sp. CFH 90114]